MQIVGVFWCNVSTRVISNPRVIGRYWCKTNWITTYTDNKHVSMEISEVFYGKMVNSCYPFRGLQRFYILLCSCQYTLQAQKRSHIMQMFNARWAYLEHPAVTSLHFTKKEFLLKGSNLTLYTGVNLNESLLFHTFYKACIISSVHASFTSFKLIHSFTVN